MTDEMKELATRAVACKHWRWMPGMLAIDSDGKDRDALVINTAGALIYEDDRGALLEAYVSYTNIPDLTDPATLGCLLALVREAWDAPAAVPVYKTGRWWVSMPHPVKAWWNTPREFSEAAALVGALEVAP